MTEQRIARIWTAPAALALITIVGLLSALFADGAADVVSWIALATPVAAVAWCVARAR
jgi:hypothetical protein